jgi:hypothetical protein
VWDRDILKPNDAVCEAMINLASVCRRAVATRQVRRAMVMCCV